MHQMHRRGVRKAQRAGVEVEVVAGPDSLAGFADLYEEVVRRHDAASFYRFAPAYWDALVGLGEHLVRLDAVLDGEPVASQLLLATPPFLHYHLGAASERGYEVGASKLLFLEAARYGAANGFAELHLGGGLGGREDSLWEFKHRLTPAPGREFWLGKLVHDAAEYRRLGGADSASGFFPAYRAPVPVEA
jgi:lipid II:glycine glycyltransferase (peptidoglycan interpeptide bridge formation enzyme)